MNNRTSSEKNTSKHEDSIRERVLEEMMKKVAQLGDQIEHAGSKLTKEGYGRIGRALFKLGNTIEHLPGKKKSTNASVKTAGKDSGAV